MKRARNKPIPELSAKEIQRFFANIQVEAEDECWPWTAGRFQQGHGGFGVGLVGSRKPMFKSSRIAYFLEHGIDPAELGVIHTCRNPPCCNPRHLFLGTQQAHLYCKLDEEKVVSIRSETGSLRTIGKKYGISGSLVSKVRNRQVWQHVA